MSGDTIHPKYYAIEEMIECIRANSKEPLHVAFADHLDKVAIAVRELDLELSQDTGPGGAADAIRACLSTPNNKDAQ